MPAKYPSTPGTGDYGTEATIELSLHAKSLGCDGLMLITPFFLRPPKQDVLNHLRRVRDRVGLPIMVYNVPLLTGTEITPQEIKMLSEEDVVHSVKWSHLEVSRIHDTRLLCGPNFPIFAGIDVIAFEAMAVGADGWISGLPMIVPALARRLHRLLDRGEKSGRRSCPLVSFAAFDQSGIPGTWYGRWQSALAGRLSGSSRAAWHPGRRVTWPLGSGGLRGPR